MVSANLATYTPTFLPNLTKYLPPISAPDFFFSVYIKAFQCFKVGDLLKRRPRKLENHNKLSKLALTSYETGAGPRYKSFRTTGFI